MLFNISFSILTGIFVLYFLSFTGFIFNIPINGFYSVISLIFALVISKKGCILVAVITLLSALLSYIFWDSSYDGRWYHQTDIIFLANGWNPIYKTAEDFYNLNINGIIWCEHYTKFVETIAANILKLTGKIEMGKMFNILFSFILFGYAYNFLSKTKIKGKLPLSLIISLNPVVLSQIFTYCVDGTLYCLSMIALFSSFEKNKIMLFSLIFSTTMALNIKFGALLFILVLYLVFIAYFLILKKYANFKQILTALFCSILLCALSGLNPYYTNIKQGKNILYPILGTDLAKKFFNNQYPKGFHEINSIERLFISTFSKTENKDEYTLKLPFTIHKSEFISMAQPDPKLGGFGALWSGVLICAFILLIYKRRVNSLFLPVYLTIILSVLLNPSSFYARYIPQAYALIWFFLIDCLSEENKVLQKLSILMAVLMVINSSFVLSGALLKSIFYYKIPISRQLKEIQLLKKPVSVYFTHELSFIEKLKEKNIPYKILPIEKDMTKYKGIMPTIGEKSGVAGVYLKVED